MPAGYERACILIHNIFLAHYPIAVVWDKIFFRMLNSIAALDIYFCVAIH